MAAKVDKEKCTGCGKCASVCPQGAISIVNEIAIINYNNCIECGICAQTCPHHAIYTEAEPDKQFSQNQKGMFSIPVFNPGIGRGRGLGMGKGKGLGKGLRDGQGRGRGGGGRRR